MFFPVGDDQVEGGHKAYFSYAFLFVNIVIFIFQCTMSSSELDGFMHHYGAIPNAITNGQEYYSLFTSMFLHAGFLHILGNMLFLWVFADNIEAIIGNANFVIFYIAGGLIASGTHIFIEPMSQVPTVGASGAISAVLGAYIVMFPKSRIKVRFLLFRPFIMTAVAFLGIWFVQNLFSGIGSLNTASAQGGGTAWWAHIGGFVFGVASGFIVKKRYRITNNNLS